jgi:hypothetical protein
MTANRRAKPRVLPRLTRAFAQRFLPCVAESTITATSKNRLRQVIHVGWGLLSFEERRVESPLYNQWNWFCSLRVAPLAWIGIDQVRRIHTPEKRSVARA